jgi:triacylglycerol esterase/lipase EstA (alpha/beta hydrolase family)
VLEALSPQRRRFVLGVLGLVLALVIAGVVVVVVRAVDSTSPVAPDRPGPVLLVTGYGGGLDSLVPLADHLRVAGRDPVAVDPVGNGTGDLQAQADHLADVVQTVLQQTGAPSVDVIGYSAGGVVARLWIRAGGARVTRRVLTIGSPQHGTTQAQLGSELAGGCPAACEQLVPGSDLLRRLNAGDETPAGADWITIRSTTDRVVTPVDSAALDGALNIVVQDFCPGATTSHGALTADPVTLAVLDSTLAAGAPAPPTSVNC